MKTLLAATLALRGATLVDGTGAPAVPDALLVIRDGRVVSAGPATPQAIQALPAGTDVADVSGKWIIPGLIDAHIHAENNADLKRIFRWGVTSIRLMSEDAQMAARFARGSSRRNDIPDVFPAAPIFTVEGGWFGQGQPEDVNLNRFPESAEAARSAVRKAKALGSPEIKLMLDDMAWCLPRPLPRMRPEIAAALLDEARKLNMRASVHAPEIASAREAVAGGATALAHGVLDPLDEKTVQVMKARPVFYIPTMDIFEFLADTRAFVDAVLSDPIVSGPGGFPEALVARYRTKAYSDGYRRRYPGFENVKRHLPSLYANLRTLHAAGVPVALGTDMWAFPGVSVSIEMDLYVRAGLTPLEAIRAATQTAARSLGAADRGTLEPGRRADFLVLSGDPLKDVKNVRRIVEIWKNGERASQPAAPKR